MLFLLNDSNDSSLAAVPLSGCAGPYLSVVDCAINPRRFKGRHDQMKPETFNQAGLHQGKMGHEHWKEGMETSVP